MEHQYISLAHDSDMLQGLERMKKYTIVREKEVREGFVDNRKVATLLKMRVDKQWEWDVRLLRDGRYLVECPSAETTRKIEKAGPMESPAFTLDFTPWTTDLYRPVKAEGVLRWVIIRNLPMFCWVLDTTARMLKPIGDLVRIGARGAEATEDFRALLRVWRPRLLPCTIHCSISTLQHAYTVEMEPGQPPLPWDTRRRTEQEIEVEPEKGAAHGPASIHHCSQIKHPIHKSDKGKAPITESYPTPVNPMAGRQGGIIIRNRQAPQPSHQPEHSIARKNQVTGEDRNSRTLTPATIMPEDVRRRTAEATACRPGELTSAGLKEGDKEVTTHATQQPGENVDVNGQNS
ncbi:hypothetical protein J5N97_029995 [Dioscorea zingiberensis]|uniref:DUF4283 domain-containing protein n=1 Tax=Dioscorea zingiberensis TaxID=325984 RepID=A0A9D5BWC3_9LILI|nr:hypothetical protein J5N97_029995 [Dioscorea zingiberensis]